MATVKKTAAKGGKPALKKEDVVPGIKEEFAPDNSMFPLFAGMLYEMRNGGNNQSRKHDFQQMFFAMMKPCSTAKEAKEMLSDMQEALDSTKTVVDSMVW